MRFILFLFLFAVGVAQASPLVIAHRGASGYYPEHTLEAYAAAMKMGADYIEPDLVLTKDGHLVVRHDIYLETTTNVTDVFPQRKSRVGEREGWFVSDFTLREIKQLRARQSFDGRSKADDDKYEIPTLGEVIRLVTDAEEKTGRKTGIYPELKAPAYFRAQGFDMASILLADLQQHGLDKKGSMVFIQSFDPEVLRQLNTRTALPLVMLLKPRSREEMNEPNMPLDEVSDFADGVGAMKYLLINAAGEDSGFMARAKQQGLFVHAWTFREDDLPPSFNTGAEELQRYLNLGIDGFFTDFPDTGVQVRNSWR